MRRVPLRWGGEGDAVLCRCPLQRCWETERVSGRIPPTYISTSLLPTRCPSGCVFHPEQSPYLPEEEMTDSRGFLTASHWDPRNGPLTGPGIPFCPQLHQVPIKGDRRGGQHTQRHRGLRGHSCSVASGLPPGWRGPGRGASSPRGAGCQSPKCCSLPASVHAVGSAAFPDSVQFQHPAVAKPSDWR